MLYVFVFGVCTVFFPLSLGCLGGDLHIYWGFVGLSLTDLTCSFVFRRPSMDFATACWWLRCPPPALHRSWETTSLSNPTRRTCTSAGFCPVNLCRPRWQNGGKPGETDDFNLNSVGHGLFCFFSFWLVLC